MNAKERSDFTQGSILKKMIPFMMPILGALILQAAYGAVDLLFWLWADLEQRPGYQQFQPAVRFLIL